MIERFLSSLAQHPAFWATARRFVEANYHAERAAIADELTPWLQPGSRFFLDLGCGTGEFAPSFPHASYLGVDISYPYLKYARTLYNVPFAVMNGQALGLRSGSIDAALITGVIHHLDDSVARAVMAELHRVLAEGATVLVMEDIPPPSAWNLPGKLMHWADRGDAIRSLTAYRALFEPWFTIERSWNIRSGICDYGVYRLARVGAAAL